MHIFSLIVVFFLLLGCGIPMGDRIDSKNLQVYYLQGVTKETATDFARYWINNGFVGDRKQVIQVERENEVYTVKLIERSMYHQQPLSIDEQAKLQELKRNLELEVFHARTIIMITDNTFRPIERK
jgi:hypothetical protein